LQKKYQDSSATTESRIDETQEQLDVPTDNQQLIDGEFDVRHDDGRVAKFDILNITEPLGESMLAIGRELDDSGRDLVDDLCSSVLSTLSEDLPAKGIIEADDLELQIEMTLRLSGDEDLVEGYLEQQA
jgi:hypothetical protein